MARNRVMRVMRAMRGDLVRYSQRGHAQDHRGLRWIQVTARDVSNLLYEQRIGRRPQTGVLAETTGSDPASNAHVPASSWAIPGPGPDPSLPAGSLRHLRGVSRAVRRSVHGARSWRPHGRDRHARGVRTILSAPPERYAAFGADLLAPVLGEYSMVLLSGEAHRSSRRLLAPPFHSARMRLYGRVMQDCARQQIEPWLARQPFPLFPVAQAISLAVMVRAVFGVTAPERVQAYERALIDVLEAVNPSFLFITALRRSFGGVGPWARFVRRRERIEGMLRDEFASRRREQQPREDILSLLLSARYEDGQPMSDTDIIGQLMTLLAAGHETTAIALSWALYLLHCHEQVLERLRDELRTLPDAADPEAVARLPLLEAVCHETLRLHPITPIIARALVAPLELMGYQLPAGVAVGASILLVHRRTDLYPEPEQFQPDRFLTRSYSPSEFLPFGGGARRCIGAAFALYEMKLVLATLLRSYRFSLETTADPGHAVRNTTVGPRRAILMRAEPL